MMPSTDSSTFIKLKKFCRAYFRTLLEIVIRALLLLICTAVLSLIVLYFYNMLWHVYRLTYVGRRFAVLYPETSQMISAVLSKDLVRLSLDATLSSFVICTITCAICQVFYFSRYFYQSQSIIGKLALWGFPLTAAVAIYTSDLYGLDHWSTAVPVTIVPTLCVFAFCFNFTEQLLPEIGEFIRKIFLVFREIISFAAKQSHQTDFEPLMKTKAKDV